MPEQQNITNIPSSRVDFIDPRTGLISREWYRFFLNIFNLAGAGGNQTSLDDLQVGPPPQPASASGSGTVTSVGLDLPTIMSVSGSPVTTSGVLTGTLTTQSVNTLFAGPSSGAAATPTFRALATADIPALAYVTSVALALPSIMSVSGSPVTSSGTLTGVLTTQNINTLFAGPSSGAADTPTFRALTTADIPALPYGTGTVTSVALALPSIMSVSGSPVTTTGTLTGTLTTQSVNTLFAGPSSGAAAAPTFRALTTTDIPSLSYVSSVGATAPITSTGGLTPTIGVTAAALSKTDDTNVTMTLSGSPSTALIAATTMGLGWTGQLAVSRGGTGAATTTANFIFAGPSSGAPAAPTFRALTTADIPSLSYVTSVALALPSIMSVSGSPVTSSGTLTGTLTTQAVNAIFAGPSSGAAAAPTFRSLTTADIPALSYVTSVAATVPAFLSISGSPITSSGTLAISYSGTALPILNGGTGQTTAAAAFNALSPVTSTGDLIIGNGTNSATRLAIGANNYVLTSNGTTATWAVATGSGATITNDTATSTNLYPLFAAATSGALANVYTGDANYLYKPSTGELTASAHVSGNGIQINSKTVATSYTIATGNNGLSAGPVSVSTGVTVTVSTGSTWVVV